MEGNYKRPLAGSTDDPYLKTFGEGVVEIADRAAGGVAAWPLRTGSLPRAARRLGRRADDRRVRVVLARSASWRDSRRTRSPRVPRGRRLPRAPARRSRPGRSPEEEFEVAVRRRSLGVPRAGPDRPAVRRLGPDEEMIEAVRPCPRRRHPDRAGVELVGNQALPARSAGRAVRRRRDLRRGRDPQAGARDLRTRRRAHRARRRRRACSLTTSVQPRPGDRARHGRPCTTASRRDSRLQRAREVANAAGRRATSPPSTGRRSAGSRRNETRVRAMSASRTGRGSGERDELQRPARPA